MPDIVRVSVTKRLSEGANERFSKQLKIAPEMITLSDKSEREESMAGDSQR